MLVLMGIHITHLFDPADSTFFDHYTNARGSRNIGYSADVLVDRLRRRANDNYPTIGAPGPLSWTKIGQEAVDIMQSLKDAIFWLFGVPLSAGAILLFGRTVLFMAALVVVFGDHLSAFFWGMEEWMECLWLMDFHLWIVVAQEIVVSYIPKKGLADGARRAKVSFPTMQEELSGAAKDPLPLSGHTGHVQEDLGPDLASVPEKLPEPPTPIPSAEPPFPSTDPSHKPVGSGTDVPGRSCAPIIARASLNWADKLRGRKKSAGENTGAATHIMEIEKLQSYFR